MARPEARTLNSLAEVLTQAQPLYDECALITNYLDPTAQKTAPQSETPDGDEESRDKALKRQPLNIPNVI